MSFEDQYRHFFDTNADKLSFGKDEDKSFLIVEAGSNLDDEFEEMFPMITFDEAVKLMGYSDWGFSDSYSTCANCGEVINTEGSMYPLHWVDKENGELICHKCTEGTELDKCVEQAANNAQDAVFWSMVSESDLSTRGWRKVGEYDTDDVKSEAGMIEILKKFPGADTLRRIISISLGYYSVEVWVKNFLVRSDQVSGLIQSALDTNMSRMKIFDDRYKNGEMDALTFERRLEYASKVEAMRHLKHDLEILLDAVVENMLEEN